MLYKLSYEAIHVGSWSVEGFRNVASSFKIELKVISKSLSLRFLLEALIENSTTVRSLSYRIEILFGGKSFERERKLWRTSWAYKLTCTVHPTHRFLDGLLLCPLFKTQEQRKLARRACPVVWPVCDENSGFQVVGTVRLLTGKVLGTRMD